jgi:RNA recognition motif-containing protein
MYEGASSPLFNSPVAQYPVTQSPSTVIYTSNVVASTQVYIPPQPVYAYPVPYMSSNFSPASAPVSPTSPTSPPLIKTEARKIIITQLPHGITSSALHELLTKTISNSKHTATFSSSSVQSVEIATHVDGKAKGHAFAVFETHAIAHTVVRAIDGLRFQGRVLSARFAKEGAEPSSRYYSGVREEQVVASSAELFQLSGLGAQWWGFGGESKANLRISEQKTEGNSAEGRSEIKSHNAREQSSGENMTMVNGGVAAWKSPGPMNAPVVVDGSSSSVSRGKDRMHPS